MNIFLLFGESGKLIIDVEVMMVGCGDVAVLHAGTKHTIKAVT